MTGMKMPVRYVAEMFCDRMAASKTYLGDKYTDDAPLVYYEKSKTHYIMHEETRALLEKMLHMLAEEGEDAAFRYIRRHILKNE